MLFTSVMSAGFSVSSALSAASMAGMASAKSLSQSSLMACAAAAASLAVASSAPTIWPRDAGGGAREERSDGVRVVC